MMPDHDTVFYGPPKAIELYVRSIVGTGPRRSIGAVELHGVREPLPQKRLQH